MTGHVNSELGESSLSWTLIAAPRSPPTAVRSAFIESASFPFVNFTCLRHTKSSIAARRRRGITLRAVSAMISAARGMESITRPRRFGSEYESWLAP